MAVSENLEGLDVSSSDSVYFGPYFDIRLAACLTSDWPQQNLAIYTLYAAVGLGFAQSCSYFGEP